VFAQTLHVANLEAGRFGGFYHCCGGGELAVREYVGVDEGIGLPELGEDFLAHRFWPRLSEADDAVIEKQAAGNQYPVQRREVRGQVLNAHVLDHPHARDLVELALDPTVVRELDREPVREPGLLDAAIAALEVEPARRHSETGDTVMPRGMDQQRSVPAANVEEAVSGLQA
jgi:hypothetical protein